MQMLLPDIQHNFCQERQVIDYDYFMFEIGGAEVPIVQWKVPPENEGIHFCLRAWSVESFDDCRDQKDIRRPQQH
jgi:hypothetical protein